MTPLNPRNLRAQLLPLGHIRHPYPLYEFALRGLLYASFSLRSTTDFCQPSQNKLIERTTSLPLSHSSSRIDGGVYNSAATLSFCNFFKPTNNYWGAQCSVQQHGSCSPLAAEGASYLVATLPGGRERMIPPGFSLMQGGDGVVTTRQIPRTLKISPIVPAPRKWERGYSPPQELSTHKDLLSRSKASIPFHARPCELALPPDGRQSRSLRGYESGILRLWRTLSLSERASELSNMVDTHTLWEVFERGLPPLWGRRSQGGLHRCPIRQTLSSSKRV
jgi:hypothetical protein